MVIRWKRSKNKSRVYVISISARYLQKRTWYSIGYTGYISSTDIVGSFDLYNIMVVKK